MRIGQKRSGRLRKQNLVRFAIPLLVLAAGIALGEAGLYRTWREFWSDATSSIQSIGTDRALPTLIVDMSFAAYDNILNQRREALETGVFIASEADFNPATIRQDDTEVPIRLRLSQGPAVHLGDDDKWNFDVRTRDDQTFLGMQRFYLIDPADNNWLNEWAFQRTLERENILSTRYLFVRLTLNGDARGIYVLQEGFGPEMITSREREQGIIVEFDSTLLWQSISHFDGETALAVFDPVTNLSASDFQYFEVDTFRDAVIARDEGLMAQKDRAIGLLRGLQNGELSASDVFDVERYGRFLALVDLWGATGNTSLVNLRYYYNPQSERLEPIGFSGNPLNHQSQGGGRLPLETTYYDPELQAAYTRAVQRVSQIDYLDQLRAELDTELERLQRATLSEVNLSLPWEQLQQRQTQIERSLNPVQPLFAYLGDPSLAISATIQIDIANVINLPLEILGFDIGGATFLEADPAWVQGDPGDLVHPRDENIVLRAFGGNEKAVLRYIRFYLPLTEIARLDDELDFMHEPEIQVATRILGMDNIMLTKARAGYPDPLLPPVP
jgi:hypothetical protein